MVYRIINIKTRKTVLLLFAVLLCGHLAAQIKKGTAVQLKLKVINDQGMSLPNAQVVIGEGIFQSETNDTGELNIQGKVEDFVTVSKSGYDKTVVLLSSLIEKSEVQLSTCKLLKSDDDLVQLPYNQIYKRNATGDYFVVTGQELEKYPNLDLRNALVALIPGLDVLEREGSTGVSPEEKVGLYGILPQVSTNGRGGLSPLWVIDDVPIDFTEMQLDPQEIETITYVKDALGKAMYGPLAGNGILFVKTKRGKQNERILNVNFESGVSSVDRFPEFVSGGDYARLNNTARINSGLVPLYSDSDISEYDKKNPYDLIYPSVDFRKLALNNTKSYKRASVTSTGGNNVVQYFTNVGYSGEGDIYKIGSSANFNRINARSNLDINVNRFMKVKVDFYGGLTLRQSPNYGYNSNFSEGGAEMDLQEFTSVIDDLTKISPIAFPVYASNDLELASPWYGVSNNFGINPVGGLVSNGYYTETGRTGAANVTFDINLSDFAKGLRMSTYGGFNVMDLVRLGKATQYAAYIVTPNADKTDVSLTLKQSSSDMSDLTKLHDYYWQRYAGAHTFSYDSIFGEHAIQSSMTYTISKMTRNGFTNPHTQQGINWMAGYTFRDKYSIQGILSYEGTQRFIGKNQYALSPVIGASWILSEEKFLSDVVFIDFLKIRGEYGDLAVETSSAPSLYQYEDNWTGSTGSTFGPYSTNRWQGTTQETSPYRSTYNRLGNPDLDWERRKEFTVGIDGLLFKQRLSVNFSYYNINRYNQLINPANAFPLSTGLLTIPQLNLGKTKYNGLESSIRFSDKVGKFNYAIGGNATYQNSKVLVNDDPNYRNDYQIRTGKPTDAYFGLVYLGKFTSEAETKLIPQLFDEKLTEGDLKYADLNKDGMIDNNDQQQIGNTTPRLFYGINLFLSYSNFELTVVGNGRAFYDVSLTNRYFRNGWGDNNYSNFVKNNQNGDYPRLTYYQVVNNFQSSSYWLRNGGFFKIQNVELAFNIPNKVVNKIGLNRVRFFARGANLWTVSDLKDVDPESLDAGVSRYPLNKTFTGGVKINF